MRHGDLRSVEKVGEEESKGIERQGTDLDN